MKEANYTDMIRKMDTDFLKKAAKKIEKMVGNKGECTVGGVSVVMLDYDGVDTRDMPLKFTAAIRMEDYTNISIDYWVEGFTGKHQDSFQYLMSDFTPSTIVKLFEHSYR